MAGNHNSGRKPHYLTIERFEKFLGNDFFHLKVETRVQSFLIAVILAMMGIVLGYILSGG